MKKEQAVMDFWFTYGWAILIVLIAIGALAYFGALDPNNFIPKFNPDEHICEEYESLGTDTFTGANIYDFDNCKSYRQKTTCERCQDNWGSNMRECIKAHEKEET